MASKSTPPQTGGEMATHNSGSTSMLTRTNGQVSQGHQQTHNQQALQSQYQLAQIQQQQHQHLQVQQQHQSQAAQVPQQHQSQQQGAHSQQQQLHQPSNVQQQQDAEAAIYISGPSQNEEPPQTNIPSIRKEKPSIPRKRSRMQEMNEEVSNVFVKEGISQKEVQTRGNRLDEFLQQVYDQVEAVFAKGERGKTMYNKQSIFDTLRLFGMELFKMVVSINNLQDEKAALQHQVIQLMSQVNNSNSFPTLAATGTPATNTYLQAVMSKSVSKNINLGKRLPVPDIPNSLQHAPSERVIIFKAERKGEQLTKEQKERFRKDVHHVIGDRLMEEVDVIRPTRNGGHTIIFQSEQSRAKALESLRENEMRENIDEESSCIVAPKKKFAKVVCRDPPDDVTMDSVLNDFYSKTNVHLHQIPRMHREARIFDTRFGWIFEMSSMEAAAIQAQAGRIRFGRAQELRVEEYIPLQQCYRCCLFGHNAKDCTSEQEYCRLCSEIGHMGWDCPVKDDKSRWKCTNCLVHNITKGYNLPINHAAAQLHKCPSALNQKEIKKAQLAAAGIFTSPIIEEHINIFSEPTNANGQRNGTGPQIGISSEGRELGKKGKSRSRSVKRNMRNINTDNSLLRRFNPTAASHAPSFPSTTSSNAASSSSHTNTQNRAPMGGNSQYGNRMMRVPRPKSYDGWKVVGARQSPTAHDALISWLAKESKPWIIALQEPYFVKKGISRLPKGYGAFWVEEGAKLRRSAIIMPRYFNGYLVSQFSNVDRTVVRIDKANLSVISIYCPGDRSITESVEGLVKESELRKNIICCMDTNAHNEQWGSIMINKKWKGKGRGIELVQVLDENSLYVCNETPHLPTFIRNTSKHNESHIDATIASTNVFNKIKEWKVLDETLSSDHRCITFVYDMMYMDVKMQVGNRQGVAWKKPNACMHSVMIDVLKKSIDTCKFPWVNTIQQVDTVMMQHSDIVRHILQSIFRKGKQDKGGKMYWWSKEVEAVYSEMRQARRRMRKYKYQDLKDIFNEKRREFRRVVRNTKYEAWRKFTNEIVDPWDKLIKIIKSSTTGKIQSRTLADLEGNYANTMHDTLILLSKQFFPTPDRLTDQHEWVEKEVQIALRYVEKGPDITIVEFRKALSEMSTSTAPGEDLITNNVIKILATHCKLEQKYVKIYNACMKNMYFPTIWKRAKIVLIPKPSSNANTVKSFRPIALTSSYGKLFERIVLARSLHYLSKGGCMSERQHAYRKGASTQTALYDVFSVVQNALSKRGGGICVAVFLDISGAFDSTWHYGILHKLLQYGVPKYLVKWIASFLHERKAYFCEGDEQHEVSLSQGCPQGGVLSPILWNVLFNEMLEIPVEVGESRGSLMRVVGYADDAVIVCKASTTQEAADMINRQLVKIHEWSIINRVKFNPAKLAALTISNKVVRPIPSPIFYDKTEVKKVDNYKYLGLLVDEKCNWGIHINSTLCKLALITKSLRGLACGRDGLSLDIYRILFHSIFVPVMLYGISIWGWKAQSKTVCMKFDKEIRKYGLMASRCQKSTANVLIFNLLRIKPFVHILYFEVLKTSIQQFHVLQSDRQGVYDTYCRNRKLREVPQCMDQQFYMYRRTAGSNIMDIEFDDVNELYRVHPSKWVQTNTIVHDVETAIIRGSDKRGWVIYTDASSSSYGVGWSIVVFKHGFCVHIGKGALSRCAIFIAEAYAIYMAVRYINGLEGLGRKEVVEIRSDAQGLVRSLERPCPINRMLVRIKDELRKANNLGKNIVLVWVPGHRDITGNVYADRNARLAVDNTISTQMFVSKEDVKTALKKKSREIDNTVWSEFTSKNVKMFLPDMNSVTNFVKSSPSSALRQIVSGHSRLNEFMSKILKKLDSSLCSCGKENETVVHFLFYCSRYDELRNEIWERFEPSFEFITRDWKKLDSFVLRTGRFDRTTWEERKIDEVM